MNLIPCSGCRGLCCGPVPITTAEFEAIKREIKSMPARQRSDLKNQERYFGTCIFYDLENDKCGIHWARPSICKAFGYYRNLICFRNPWAASEKDWVAMEDPAGVLSIHYKWKDFE